MREQNGRILLKKSLVIVNGIKIQSIMEENRNGKRRQKRKEKETGRILHKWNVRKWKLPIMG